MVPCSGPGAAFGSLLVPRPNLRLHVLAPGPRHRAEVDDELARLEQVQLLVDLLQLVRGAGPVALALGELDVRIGQVVVQPRLVELLGLSSRRHGAPIIEA